MTCRLAQGGAGSVGGVFGGAGERFGTLVRRLADQLVDPQFRTLEHGLALARERDAALELGQGLFEADIAGLE